MLSLDEALNTVAQQTARLPLETIELADASGRVLAEDVVADTDLPPFDRAMMDGFAVRARDTEQTPARLRVVGEAAAGSGWNGEMRDGEAVRIMTGARVPKGADSVQKVEVTREREEDGTVEIDQPATLGLSIARRGGEVREGATVLTVGETIRSSMIATLAAFGYAQVRVGGRPRVAVLATGAELVPPHETPGVDQIRDSNSFSLLAYAQLAGAIVERLPVAPDEPEQLRNIISEAASRADVLVLSGGVSMGVYDFTKSALRELGANIFFERVALRPGKPTVFARLGNTLVFGLPGNPVSSAVTFNLFARLAILAMQGAQQPGLREEQAMLGRAVKGALGRISYLPASLSTNSSGQLTAEPLKWGGSSDFVGFARATALVIVPADVRLVEANALVSVVHLPS